MAELLDSGARREAWLPVVGYEGLYEVSDVGRVKSLQAKTRISDKQSYIMRQKLDTHGYYRINLHKSGKCTAHLVSRLVAGAFISNSENFPYVGHDDDNKTNNDVKNLYWTNASENLTHNGLHLKIAQKRNIQAVKDALSIPIIGVSQGGEILTFFSYQEAARNGFSSAHICQCINKKRTQHKGYMWYKEAEYYGIS